MLKREEHRILVGLGILVCTLVIGNAGLVVYNRSLQGEIQHRTQFVQQTGQLEVLYREMVKALADLSVKQQDGALSALLTAHGITVTVNGGNGAAPVSTPGESGRKGGGK